MRLEPGQVAHRPQLLPASDWMLFTITAGVGDNRWDVDARVVAQSLRTGDRKVLVEGASNASYLPTGHLVYVRRSTLHAVPFDAAAVAVAGEALPLIEGVRRLPLFPAGERQTASTSFSTGIKS